MKLADITCWVSGSNTVLPLDSLVNTLVYSFLLVFICGSSDFSRYISPSRGVPLSHLMVIFDGVQGVGQDVIIGRDSYGIDFRYFNR